MLGCGYRVLTLTALLIAVLTLLEGVVAAAQAKVEGGFVEGTVEGTLKVYRGIPFAAPPVGNLRWRAPQPVKRWRGVRRADKFAPECIQTGLGDPRNWNPGALPPSEDCLYLNVWTPAKRGSERLPVLVWIYPGGFRWGASSDRMYSGEELAKRGVVLVSIAYRVGVFGFLAHPGLSAENEKHVSGNYGMLDMIAGLQWIQTNISSFGGDPKRVTIFGESAGAIAVSMLCASPLAKGLFQGAISQSGGSFGPVHGGGRGPGENLQTLAEAEQAGAAWAEAAGASTPREMRMIPPDKVLATSQSQRGVTWPIVDEWVIPDDQYTLYQAGHHNDVPILIGYNSDEGASFSPPSTPEAYVESVRQRYGPFAESLLKFYAPGNGMVAKTARDLTRDVAFGWHTWAWAHLQSKTGKSRVFFYYFDYHPDYPAGSPQAGFGAMHGTEGPYVFEHLGGTKQPPATVANLAISKTMAAYWTNFAKRGDPNGEGLPNWPAFAEANPQVMHFAHTAQPGPVVSQEGLEALDSYFEWRRSGGAETQSGPAGGIAVKKPVFGGACKICPWGALGEIVQRMMRPYGYEVQMCYNCNRADAPRIVAEARIPPPYEPDPVVSAILAPPNAPGLGPVDFGATALQFFVQAYRGTGLYAGEKPRTNLRLIANIQDPHYVLLAIKKDAGITDLAQIKQKRWPVRVLIAGTGGDMANSVLAYYGLSRESIEAAGGHIGTSVADRNDFDVAIGAGGVMTTAPEWTVWTEISEKFDLTFVQLPEELLAKLSKETGQEIGVIPVGLYRGIDHPIRTLVRTGTVIYGRADMPDDFAYAVAKAIDEQQDLLQWSHLNFSYNIHNVGKADEVPLHPGAARYYKEMGYMKQPVPSTLSSGKQ